MASVFVVNAGSSSIKFKLFPVDASMTSKAIGKGQFDGIGSKPRLHVSNADNAVLVDQTFAPEEASDVTRAMQITSAWLRSQRSLDVVAVGHRVVHGGPRYDKPILVDEQVLTDLERLVPLAPLHQPNNLAPIRAIFSRIPDLPQVACFDTAFHRGHAEVADHYAIPEQLYAEGVRRYGFHGLSYEYIATRFAEVAPEIAKARVIVAHLGSGASMCALADGRSIESTMGFTALDGLPMGTRSGQIDPGILLYLQVAKNMSAKRVQDFLYSECGLKGLSGESNDVRELLASDSPGAKLAIDHFVYRIGLHAGMLAAALGGLDAFVFTAGIGERSSVMRTRIVERLSWLGADLDLAANESAATKISTPASRVALYVIPTDEELMIAKHTRDVVSASRPQELTVRSA